MKKLLYIIALSLLPITAVQSQTDYNFGGLLANQAYNLTFDDVTYDPVYVRLDYPNGDVASNTGVCTDVVIRAYRKMGIDLQVDVHEDMVDNFSIYPKFWSNTKADSNIDHRRVPNLMTFFKRFGSTLVITNNPKDYYPGDIVCWNVGGGRTHIGIVSNYESNDGLDTPLIVHNIGGGQNLEDFLFKAKIIGHYTYGPISHSN